MAQYNVYNSRSRIFEIEWFNQLPLNIKLSNGEKFYDIEDFYNYIKDLEPTIFHGNNLVVITTALKGRKLSFKKKGNGIIIGNSILQNADSWNLDLPANYESELKIEKILLDFRIQGGVIASTPAIATLWRYTSISRHQKVAKISTLEALLGSTNYKNQKFLPYGSFKPAYNGGLLGNPAEPGKLYENVISYDLNSAYPAAALAYNFPTGDSIIPENYSNLIIEKGIIKDYPDYGFIGLFKFKGINRKTDVFLPCVSEDIYEGKAEFDRLGLLSGEITLAASSPEFALFELQYTWESMEILELSIHRVAKLPHMTRKFLAEVFSKKISKYVTDATVPKLIMNSLIGIWGRDPLKDFKNPIESIEDIENSLLQYNGDQRKRPSSLNSLRTWDFRWAIYLTSYVRYFIANTAKMLTEAGIQILYADTDSIKCIGDKETARKIFEVRNNQFKELFVDYDIKFDQEIFDRIGQFEDESSSYESAVFFKKRMYLRSWNGGQQGSCEPVISGANKESMRDQLFSFSMEDIEKSDDLILYTPTKKAFKSEDLNLEEFPLNSPLVVALAYGQFSIKK